MEIITMNYLARFIIRECRLYVAPQLAILALFCLYSLSCVYRSENNAANAPHEAAVNAITFRQSGYSYTRHRRLASNPVSPQN